ncbi:DUF2076 domain-containing protein [Aureimonas altamirensis]|uniref:DUF2076 domain-containing protein n=1 Tax=Aureimonas altamirensis TaxID=370622 RepID=UPI00203739D4|nr:DUF2076 domain-containing protein [Aureimonas altamirensis]MCM2503084.1 DUF2076 domain-containing protein [Aureimonas altamirensis]
MSMNAEEKRLIEGLFTRLGMVEREATPRDGEAEAFIQQRLSAQPAAPYYMAQTIIVQEQALEAAQERIRQLESRSQESGSGGGLLGSLFGGSQRGQRPDAPTPRQDRTGGAMPAGSPWGGASGAQAQPAARQGGGFLAGAAQTAVGVAGGMMLGSMLGSMFGGAGDAIAGEVDNATDGLAEDVGMDGFDDGGGFGDFDDI